MFILWMLRMQALHGKCVCVSVHALDARVQALHGK